MILIYITVFNLPIQVIFFFTKDRLLDYKNQSLK